MNKFLLDTCTLLWLELDPARVPKRAMEALKDRKNEVFLSAVSVWEIVLKWRAGKLTLPSKPSDFVTAVRSRSSIEPLELQAADVLQSSKLQDWHRDPFDRMLIAQAIERGLTLVTPDPLISQYAVRILWE